MKISIATLSSQRLERVIAQVQNYGKRMDRNAGKLAKRLAEVGAAVAAAGFASDLNYIPREDAQSVAVSAEKSANEQSTYVLKAAGKAVAFLEFGAGVTYLNQRHPWAGKVTPPMGPGTYPGKGQWLREDGWYVPGTYDKSTKMSIKTLGNAPTMAMYDAFTEMKNNVNDFAKEVFK